MGARGPAPKPTKLKLLHGNPGKRKLGKEPSPATAIPTPPKELAPAAVAEWERVTKELEILGLVSQLDRATLTIYCEAWAEFVAALAWVKKKGHTAETCNGTVVQHPMVGVKNKAAERVLKIADRFGFSPSARARLTLAEQEDLDDFDAFERRKPAG